MKIYKTAHSFSITFQKNRLCVNASDAGKFYFDSGKVTYIAYSEKPVPYRYFKFRQQWYIEHVTERVIPFSFIPYKNKKITLKDLLGNELDLPAEKIYCIINSDSDVEHDQFVTDISDYPNKGDDSLALYNSNTDLFSSAEFSLFGWVYRCNFFYGYNFLENELIKVDSNFDKIWLFEPSFDPVGPAKLVITDNKIVAFLGPKTEARNLVNGRSQYTFSGGVLVGLNDSDGSLAWEMEIPKAVDNYQLVDGILYVAALNEVLLINPKNGELINSIDTDTTEPFDRSLGPSVYVDESFIYYSHYDDAVILIYDKSSLALQRRIELPPGYYAKGHNFHDEVSGKQYFTLANRTQYVAQGPVLEIGPQNLDEEVEFEQEPNSEIKLQASPDNADEQELVIRLTSESLDDALRFGEIYTRDEAQRYSYNYVDMTFQDRPFMPEKSFNGVIRFIYSGCDQGAEVVNKHLRVMEKRFAKWNEKEGFFACTDKKKPTCLIAEYAE